MECGGSHSATALHIVPALRFGVRQFGPAAASGDAAWAGAWAGSGAEAAGSAGAALAADLALFVATADAGFLPVEARVIVSRRPSKRKGWSTLLTS